MPESRLLGIVDAAAYIGLAPRTLRALVATGALPVVKLPSARRRGEPNRRILIDRSDLDIFIAQHKGASN